VDSVSAGSFHSAFLLRNGNMYVCGSSDSHRLGLRAHSDASIVAMTYHPSPCPVEDLEEIGFSFDSHDTSGVKLLSCGVWHTVAVLKETNDVYAWGWAKFGQFGRSSLRYLTAFYSLSPQLGRNLLSSPNPPFNFGFMDPRRRRDISSDLWFPIHSTPHFVQSITYFVSLAPPSPF
jgi:alpha-tubulin suppressor-like RCC1 family protein